MRNRRVSKQKGFWQLTVPQVSSCHVQAGELILKWTPCARLVCKDTLDARMLFRKTLGTLRSASFMVVVSVWCVRV